jgi:hypothetical protein
MGLATATDCSSARASVPRFPSRSPPAGPVRQGCSTLALLKHEFGDLDRVTGWVKALGFVACVDGSPGAGRDQRVQRFDPVPVGRCGRHARPAIGAGELPSSMMVEIEAVAIIA